MRQPFRRYCFFLGEKLGRTLEEILAMDNTEICEWMAYDLANNEEWQKKYLHEKEMERQRNLPAKDRVALLKNLFNKVTGGKYGDNSKSTS